MQIVPSVELLRELATTRTVILLHTSVYENSYYSIIIAFERYLFRLLVETRLLMALRTN
jgi:hypothetical protein